MSAAVTGASGFFGKALVKALRDSGDSVRAIASNSFSGPDLVASMNAAASISRSAKPYRSRTG